MIYPHVTLTIFDGNEENVEQFLEISPFKITLKTGGISTFRNKENTLFIEIEKTLELTKLFDIYKKGLTNVCYHEYYQDKNYTPHITLATNLSVKELEEALEISKDLEIPKEIVCKDISLFDENYKLISRKIISI